MPFLYVCEFFSSLPCCGLYRRSEQNRTEKECCSIYLCISKETLLFSPTPSDVHVLKNRIINGSSFSSSFFRSCFFYIHSARSHFFSNQHWVRSSFISFCCLGLSYRWAYVIASNDAAYEHIEETQLTWSGSNGMKNGQKNSCAHKHQPISTSYARRRAVFAHILLFFLFFLRWCFLYKTNEYLRLRVTWNLKKRIQISTHAACSHAYSTISVDTKRATYTQYIHICPIR